MPVEPLAESPTQIPDSESLPRSVDSELRFSVLVSARTWDLMLLLHFFNRNKPAERTFKFFSRTLPPRLGAKQQR